MSLSLRQRFEELRKQAGLEVRDIAAKLGMSRSTLWRRLGSGQLRPGEVAILAETLRVSRAELLGEDSPGQWEPEPDEGEETPSDAGRQLQDFMSDADNVVRYLSSESSGSIDQRVKLAILNGIEQVARETGNRLPKEYFALRERVLHGET